MGCRGILIIEDDPDVRNTLQEILEHQGFEVFAAANGEEGLARLQEGQSPCLILLDLMMPIMNGWEFLSTLKSQHQHYLTSVPIVIVSAIGDLSSVQNEYNCSAMSKPVDLSGLIKIAEQACAGQGS